MEYKETREVIEKVFDNYNSRKDVVEELKLSENPIVDILNYFTIALKLKNLPRNKYDLDSVHIYNTEAKEKGLKRFRYSLNADIMISFFTPYARAIELVTGKRYYKGKYEDIKELINLFNKEGYKEVNEHFQKFAKLYATRGNIIVLPDGHRDMNRRRYSISQDKIEKTLYECFKGGKLAENFKDDKELKLWIKNENLEVCFKDGKIEKDFIDDDLMKYFNYSKYSEIDDEKIIYEYIDKIVKIIETRNKIYYI